MQKISCFPFSNIEVTHCLLLCLARVCLQDYCSSILYTFISFMLQEIPLYLRFLFLSDITCVLIFDVIVRSCFFGPISSTVSSHRTVRKTYTRNIFTYLPLRFRIVKVLDVSEALLCRYWLTTLHTAGFLVFVEVALERERFTASSARVWFHIAVCLSVCSQVGFIGEGFSADWAGERTLSRVCANVALKKPWTREVLAAVLARANWWVWWSGGVYSTKFSWRRWVIENSRTFVLNMIPGEYICTANTARFVSFESGLDAGVIAAARRQV